MSLKLNSASGGSVTLQEPATTVNQIVSIPDATTTLVGTTLAQTLSNKTLTNPTIILRRFQLCLVQHLFICVARG